MRKIVIQVIIATTVAGSLQAQVGIGTVTPDGSAQLEISALNKGLLIPRITQANRPVSPATGLLIYQTDNTPGYYYYNGKTWKMLPPDGTFWSLTGNSGTTLSHFIGTTDNNPLIFKVNGEQAGYINPVSGDYLLSFGYQSGTNNIGLSNTLMGYQAAMSNSGSFNKVLGNTGLGAPTRETIRLLLATKRLIRILSVL